MLKDLAVAFPNTRLRSTDVADLTFDFVEFVNLKDNALDQLKNINYALQTIDNLNVLLKYVDSEEYITVGQLYHVEGYSEEDLIPGLRSALISIKNFFLNLCASIKAFFKRMFDANAKARFTINKLMNEFMRSRSYEADKRIPNLRVLLTPHQELVKLLSDLTILFNDTVDASKAVNIRDYSIFNSGINLFGRRVENGEIIDDGHSRIIQTMNSCLGDTNPNWGWSSDNAGSTSDKLIIISKKFCELLINAEALNAVNMKLENECLTAARTIDKFIALDKMQDAQLLQSSLAEQSKRSTFVFKSNAIFQSYVTQISVQLIDVWTNLNAINKQYK